MKWPKDEKALALAIAKANKSRNDRIGVKEINMALSKKEIDFLFLRKKLTWPKRWLKVTEIKFKKIAVVPKKDGVWAEFYFLDGGVFYRMCPVGKIGDIIVTPSGAHYQTQSISLDKSFYWIISINPKTNLL